MIEYTVTEEESAPSSGEVALFYTHGFACMVPYILEMPCSDVLWDSYLAMLQIKIDNLQRYKLGGKTIDVVSLISLQVCQSYHFAIVLLCRERVLTL